MEKDRRQTNNERESRDSSFSIAPFKKGKVELADPSVTKGISKYPNRLFWCLSWCCYCDLDQRESMSVVSLTRSWWDGKRWESSKICRLLRQNHTRRGICVICTECISCVVHLIFSTIVFWNLWFVCPFRLLPFSLCSLPLKTDPLL